MLNQMQGTISKVQPIASKRKILHLMRHGVTEMNEHLHKVGYPPPKDPMMWDTVLTSDGRHGASKKRREVSKLNPQPQILLVSPLTRTLQTADLAFEDYKGPRQVEVGLRERLYLSSDVGSTPDFLNSTFPHYDFSSLQQRTWWYDPLGLTEPRPASIKVEQLMEPEDIFKRRCEDLRVNLASRSEEVIAIVSHWGVLRELTGREFDNVELRTFYLDIETKRITAA